VNGRRCDILLRRAKPFRICLCHIFQLSTVHIGHVTETVYGKLLRDLVILLHRIAKRNGCICTITTEYITSRIIRITCRIYFLLHRFQIFKYLAPVLGRVKARCSFFAVFIKIRYNIYHCSDRTFRNIQPRLRIRNILLIILVYLT